LLKSKNRDPKHKYLERAAGRENNAATIHIPQTVATVERHVGFEETWKWRGSTVATYRWMLSIATEYADRPTDIR
jgi:predicted GNAT superfamily acetyltransferase